MIVVLGLLSLSFLVLVHELGHYVMARLNGIRVETFSIGMGPMLLKKHYKGTLWAISLLPIGGYCKLAGDNYPSSSYQPEEGELYFGGVRKRFLTVLGGPFFSILFAYFCFIVVANLPHLVVPIEPIVATISSDALPFEDGDRVLAINDIPIKYANELEAKISSSGSQNLYFTVQRGLETININKRVELLDNGQGYLPIEAWQDAIVGGFSEQSVVKNVLQIGDKIITVNNMTVKNSHDFRDMVEKSRGAELLINYIRHGKEEQISIKPMFSSDKNHYFVGLYFATPSPIKIAPPAFPKAFMEGNSAFFSTTKLYFQSMANLFKGAKLYRAVSGPVKTTYLIGSVAKAGLEKQLSLLIGFLGFISLILGIMNLLPIPLLDGGHLLLFIVEAILGRPLSESSFKIYQVTGMMVLLSLMAIALFSDAISIMGR